MYVHIRSVRDVLDTQIIAGQCYVGPDAARVIAERIQNEHGFWDFEERKRLHEQGQLMATPAPVVPITGGKTQAPLTRRFPSGEGRCRPTAVHMKRVARGMRTP